MIVCRVLHMVVTSAVQKAQVTITSLQKVRRQPAFERITLCDISFPLDHHILGLLCFCWGAADYVSTGILGFACTSIEDFQAQSQDVYSRNIAMGAWSPKYAVLSSAPEL